MAALVALAKLTGGPGSLRLIAILTAMGLIWWLAVPRHRLLVSTAVVAVFAAYFVMALPVVAAWTMARIPADVAATDAEVRGVQTLFIFDGDNRWGRLREVQRVYDAAQPREVVLLGRLSVYKDLLLMPIERKRLRHDTESWNTSSQVERTRALLHANPTAHAAVLASRLQAPRVRLLLRQAGLPLPVIASPLDTELPDRGLRRFVPSLAALATTRDALYEAVALRYYR